MFFGIVMVAVGLLLIVLLFRRSRQDRQAVRRVARHRCRATPVAPPTAPAVGRRPRPVAPAQVYGQQPPAAGGVPCRPRVPPPAGSTVRAPAVPPVPEATQPMPGRPGTGRPLPR